nr:immunoglobulin light chain junction region [Macaca mulatta]
AYYCQTWTAGTHYIF